MYPLVLKMRRLTLEDSPQDRELLRLIPPQTRGQPRRWPPVRQTQDSEPPTWGQIKKLMDMAMMVASNLGMAGNLTVTLLVTLVIITMQVSAVQGDAYWTFMPTLSMVHPITWQSHPASNFTSNMVHMGGHSSGHFVPQYSDYNFTGMSSSLPICVF
jgi:hypothetical protein